MPIWFDQLALTSAIAKLFAQRMKVFVEIVQPALAD